MKTIKVRLVSIVLTLTIAAVSIAAASFTTYEAAATTAG